MLFFEFFPAFVALVSLLVGVALWRANARAEREGTPEPERPRPHPPDPARPQAQGKPRRRPSMSA